MKLNMGTKITALRRQKGMTQEQLAAALGVSAPAVSKWETDSSYPDITLLCPLARALGTDVDNLLTFEEELSQEKLGRYMTEIIETARQGDLSGAEEQLNALLHRYPSDMSLKFSAIGALSFLEMNLDIGPGGDGGEAKGREDRFPRADYGMAAQVSCGGAGEQTGERDRQRFARQKKDLARALHDDGNPAFYLSSVSMLISLALAEGEMEEAERLLKENLTNTADFTPLWVQFYLKKGERDQALGILQRQAYRLVSDLRVCLMYLMRKDLGLERDRVLEICGILEQMEDLFSVGDNSAGLFAEIYLREGEQEQALRYLERLVDQMTGQMAPPNPLVFSPAIAPGPEKLHWSRELKLAALQGLQRDACFDPLRKLERFQKIVRELADSLEASPQ